MCVGLGAGLLAAWSSSAVAGSGGPLVVSVAPEPLTARAFRPFGPIIDGPEGRAPTFKNAVMRFWGGLAKAPIREQMEFGLFTVKTRVHEFAEMQRHIRTPKFLISLDTAFYLAVAPSAPPQARKARPDAAEVKVFLVKQGQALLLNKRVWHTLPFPKEAEGQFLVAFRDGTWKKDRVLRAFRSREILKF